MTYCIHLQSHKSLAFFPQKQRRNRTSHITVNFRSQDTLKCRNGIFTHIKIPFQYFNAWENSVLDFGILPYFSVYSLGKPHYLSVGGTGNNDRGTNKIGREKGGDKLWTTPEGGRKFLDFPRRGAKNFRLG